MTLKILPMYCTGPENDILGPVDALCEVTQHGNKGDVWIVEDVVFVNDTGRTVLIDRSFVYLGPVRVQLGPPHEVQHVEATGIVTTTPIPPVFESEP